MNDALALRCLICQEHLVDYGTPLPNDGALVAALAQLHDMNEHGGARGGNVYEAIAKAVEDLQPFKGDL